VKNRSQVLPLEGLQAFKKVAMLLAWVDKAPALMPLVVAGLGLTAQPDT